MGTTLNNIHLSVSRDAVDRAHSSTVAALRQYMDSLGFVEVDQDSAQTAIIIASDQETPWVSVYLGKHLDWKPVTPLLSQSVQKPVLLVEVFDSDVVTLTLYENGQQADVFSNWINYESSPRRHSGRADRWRAILPEDQTPETLAQAWRTDKADYPFEAEGILKRVVDLFELASERVWFDPRYEQFPPEISTTILFYRPQ
ncbi:MAG TPA: hypothetical protein VMT24_03155 [Aggregatilineaceae bacterium]|nr:hypothetical protein [Aggregatilineaceae bacterium]